MVLSDKRWAALALVTAEARPRGKVRHSLKWYDMNHR
jgi:hypothetical protein